MDTDYKLSEITEKTIGAACKVTLPAVGSEQWAVKTLSIIEISKPQDK